jgi:hypothetical protein
LISRQKLVGWVLIAASVAYIVYFWRTRLISPGPAIANAEWFQIVLSLVVLMLGTINVRLAAMRERKRSAELSD